MSQAAPPPKSKTKVRLLILVAVVVLLVFCLMPLRNLLFPEYVERRFRDRVNAALPLGTPKAQVDAWLNEHRSSEGITFLAGIALANGGRIRGIGGEIKISEFLFGWTEIRFEFYFDDQDKLEKFTTRLVHLGL